MEELPPRPIRQRLELLFLDPIELTIDPFELFSVQREIRLATGRRRNGLEVVHIDDIVASGIGVPDPHGVDGDAPLRRDFGRFGRRHLATRVVSVRQQYQNAFFRLSGVEELDGETNGFTNGRTGSDHAYPRLSQKLTADLMVQCERDLKVSRVAKNNQSNAVPLPPGDKLIQDELDGFQPVDAIALGIREVSSFH